MRIAPTASPQPTEQAYLLLPPPGAARRRPPPTPCSVAFGALRVAGRRWFRRGDSGAFALARVEISQLTITLPLVPKPSRALGVKLLAFIQSQQSRRATPTAHAPRHTPSRFVIADSRVSRILRELGRSPATLLGTGVTMYTQRHQQLKRQSLLAERAHAMRHQPTPSEAKLWAAISAGQLGISFKRQVPIGQHIVDVLAPAVKLVIEVDGSSHARRCGADARKDRALTRLGYKVLRLQAELVVTRLPVAVVAIRAALDENE
jgi:very-short-patch-repair endonuclease